VVGELRKARGEESVVDGGEEHGGVQAVLAVARGPRRRIRRSKTRLTWSGRPMSRLSRMTCSKKTRPDTGRSSIWVRENSAGRIDSS